MLTINELAIKSDAPAHVVRYYVRIGLIEPAGEQDNGYRLFASQAVTRLRFIRTAKNLGFTLNEIKQITRHADTGESPCDDVRKIIQHRIQENRVKIKEMRKLQDRMEQALTRWQSMPNGMPNGNSVCHLIESIESEQEEVFCHVNPEGSNHGTSGKAA